MVHACTFYSLTMVHAWTCCCRQQNIVGGSLLMHLLKTLKQSLAGTRHFTCLNCQGSSAQALPATQHP
jgi:hypothetical protein